MAKEYQGACLCGAVHYTVKGPFLRFFFCHCSRCRRSTGTAHAANTFVRAGNVTFTQGENHIKRFDLPDA
ncbi:MAG TPA: GFA family protein, partial [Turneriella sp.]|nr:GFA family protein [Turneriella sp.]